MPQVIVAESAGFCYGVARAVGIVEQLLAAGRPVCTLGPIIHNTVMVDTLARQGARAVSAPEEVRPGETLVLRAHGVEAGLLTALSEKKLDFIDATCPFVAKIHRIVNFAASKGDTIIIVGDKNHPEVAGIRSRCSDRVFVVETQEELRDVFMQNPDLAARGVTMVAQTTYSAERYRELGAFAKKLCPDLERYDTICDATGTRQAEAAALAQTVDLMVVVGSQHSSNTRKLVELCAQYVKTLAVETAADLRADSLQGCRRIGVTAGASAPTFIIKEVQQTMSEVLHKPDEDVVFEEALEDSLKNVYNGEKVTGIVVGISPNEIAVDIGTKHAGFVPLDELTDDPTAKVEDIVKKGDEIELIVVRVNDVEGTVKLSKKRFDAAAGFEKIMNAVDTGEILDGVVVDVVKGGMLVMSNGVRVFVSASQSGVPKDGDLNVLLKQPVRFKILEVNRGRRRAVGSIRAVQREEKKKLAEEFWGRVAIGDVYKGEVKSLTSYGAFVDLGGVDGMVHISELSWNRIKHPSEVVKVGDVVEVYVKDLDFEKHKISLGYKKAEDNPWEIFKRDYPVGTVCKATIVSMTTFGAFARILPGIDGLIHISQIARERIAKPSDALSVGDVVDVKITEADLEKRRISLSIRALLEEQDASSASDGNVDEEPFVQTFE